ncbi:hypothetical protein [Methylobacter sp.]|uniref:hypothetical protein n=1 Tax=Methylobacter sp. TaxID=2051955 RepID=UPI003DA5C9FE
MNLTQALITGTFGVVVAIVTWLLAGLREKSVYKRELKKEPVNKLESLYAQTISQLEQLIRITQSGESSNAIDKQASDSNALLRLLSTNEVNTKLEEVSDLLYSWSSNYRQGAPKRINNSDVAIISSQDSKHQKAAEELFPCLNNEIISLIKIMREHLEMKEKHNMPLKPTRFRYAPAVGLALS